MTRDEILKQSRKENTGLDEREQQIHLKASNIGGAFSFSVAMFLMFINVTADGPDVVNAVIWAIYWSRQSVEYGYKAFHLKKRSYWVVSVLFALTTAIFIWLFLKIILGW